MHPRVLQNTTEKPTFQMTESILIAYYPMFLIIFGSMLTFWVLFILRRGTFRHTKRQPTIHYMRATIVFDILMLYGWNLQHYLMAVYGFTLERYSISSCKFFLFFSYFAAQSSAWLRVFVCLDRFLSLHYLHKTWFSRSKNVLIIIAGLLTLLILFNLHLSILGCSYNLLGEIVFENGWYRVFPLWDYINLVVYNCIPFICMVLLNAGVIYHLVRLRRTRTIQNSRIQHRSLSITSLITTFLFLSMTIPASIAFGFFANTTTPTILYLTDACLFTYHITSFPLYMITFSKFRRESLQAILCRKADPRIGPFTATRHIPPKNNDPLNVRLKTTANVIQQINHLQHHRPS